MRAVAQMKKKMCQFFQTCIKNKIENWDMYMFGPFLFKERVTRELYLNMLGNKLLSEIRLQREDMPIPQWSMEHGSSLHYAIPVRLWIRMKPVKWTSRSPDLSQLE